MEQKVADIVEEYMDGHKTNQFPVIQMFQIKF
jgi:hypothetical protein